MTLRVQVVSAEREIWSGEAAQVSARTAEGDIGVLTGHVPTLAVLAAGEVRITPESGEPVLATVDGGFLSVEHDTVLVVAERARTGGADQGAGA